MGKALTKLSMVSEEQVAFGRKIGLDLGGCTLEVAAAKIEDLIALGFWGKDPGRPTEKQTELAAKFEYDISRTTRRVGTAIIDGIMEQLNLEAIEQQGLMPGDVVTDKRSSLKGERVISSIRQDGLVFFKGGHGAQAFARNLRKVGQVIT